MSAEIPQGLTELLEEFAIAVLREKPEDLVAFAARYFNTQLASRQARKGTDETGMDTEKPATGEGMEMGNEGKEKRAVRERLSRCSSPSHSKIRTRKTFRQLPT